MSIDKPEPEGALFYMDKTTGKKSDSLIHEEILAGGSDDMDAFDQLIEELGLSEVFAATFKEDE